MYGKCECVANMCGKHERVANVPLWKQLTMYKHTHVGYHANTFAYIPNMPSRPQWYLIPLA